MLRDAMENCFPLLMTADQVDFHHTMENSFQVHLVVMVALPHKLVNVLEVVVALAHAMEISFQVVVAMAHEVAVVGSSHVLMSSLELAVVLTS